MTLTQMWALWFALLVILTVLAGLALGSPITR